MIPQLVRRRATALANPPGPLELQTAMVEVLGSDPLDLVLHMEQVWNAANVWAPNPPPAGPARQALVATGRWFPLTPTANPAWDHFGYSFCIDNTRAGQILARVVRAFRSGEGLGVPSVSTQRWLDVTETLLLHAQNPLAFWLSTSTGRPDPEWVRRSAYWRMFAMDLSFGDDSNAPAPYPKAEAANRGFVPVLEELLFELWRAIENIRNIAGANTADDDRIYRLAEQIGYMLRSRRQNSVLAREELAAATVTGWLELTLAADTPVVVDLRAQATSPADRLKNIGERVGLAPHSRASSFFSMATELSVLLRALEAGYVSRPDLSPLLYTETPPPGSPPNAVPLGVESRRVITEWSAATGRDLKQAKSSTPVQVRALAAR